MNNNEDISFNQSYSVYTPNPFPITSVALLAAYWGDVDTRGTGSVSYRITTNSTLLARFNRDIPQFLSTQNVNPLWLLIATWDHVGYYNKKTDKVWILNVQLNNFSN